jgi:hypothetical protein
MSALFVRPVLQRTLSAVYWFYDVFFYPPDDRVRPISAQLDVTIPELRWQALRSDDDLTYRFSALTLTQPAPVGTNLAVQVVASQGDFVSFEPILLSLPLPLSAPPSRADFLLPTPLWPTVAFRPPAGETAIRGQIQSATMQPVADLKVEMWPGPDATPPAGTPYTRTNATGDFLYRFPWLKRTDGSSTVSINTRINDGIVPVFPSSLSIEFGSTQIIQLQRT